jgi:RNA polymerase sigma factor (sigma-70 family)
MEDTLLIASIREGQKPAFDALYQKYWKFALNMAYKRTNQLDVSKDIVQDVFLHLWLHLSGDTSEPIYNVQAYLAGAIRNQCYKWISNQTSYPIVGDVWEEIKANFETAEYQIVYEELLSSYSRIVENLPVQQQLIFKKRYEQGLSSDEIATEMGLAPKTVRNHLGKAVEKVKSSFEVLFLTPLFFLLNQL